MYHHFEAVKLRSCHTSHKQIHDEKRSNNKSNTNAINANLHLSMESNRFQFVHLQFRKLLYFLFVNLMLTRWQSKRDRL